jgi:hypothetical protein
MKKLLFGGGKYLAAKLEHYASYGTKIVLFFQLLDFNFTTGSIHISERQ